MAKTPAISVVIPCYNGGRDLPGALDSVRAQTFSNYEIIVVDDGSTDPETGRILDGLGESIRLIRQPNRGLPAARNAGVAVATGDYILPLDCDDRLAPDFLEKTLLLMRRHPKAGFAFTYLRLSGDKHGILRKNYNFFVQLFLNQLPYCMLIRREVLVTAGAYDESLREGYEDWEFNIRLGRHGYGGVLVPEALFHYRVSESGMLKSLSNKRHAELWGAIQGRHKDLYTPAALYRCWKEWRRAPMPYPAPLLAGFWLLHRCVPASVFNKIFADLLGRGAAARLDAPDGA